MSKRQYEVRIKNWKTKAISRRKENEYLKKREQELIKSRDKWKSKYQAEKLVCKKVLLDSKKAKGHHYNLVLVVLMIELYKYGSMSLRSCRHTISCLYLCLGLEGKIPCHNSIRNWICKCGLSRVKNTSIQNDSYVIYVDESISFGSEKILLILGVNMNNIPKSRSLCHADMEVLDVEIGQEWKGDQVAESLKKATLNKTIKYVVSDQGNNLRKAYKILNYKHVEDCTHVFANDLKRLYKSDEDFIMFSKLIGKLRQKWNLSKINSQYMPPSMRGKLRFANIFPSVNWAKKILQNWEDLPSNVQEELLFLRENEAFIIGLMQVEKIFKTVCEKLKNHGFGQSQKKELFDNLATIQTKTWNGLQPKANIFMENIKVYLENLDTTSKVLNEEFLLCSSDIIESYFGKFKAKVNPNSRSGLTEFIFTIATFGKTVSIDETQNALESIKCKQLKQYKTKTKAA
ncbi:MAG: hypothetical protein AB8G11_21065 [Saprospiraceae bacterium]